MCAPFSVHAVGDVQHLKYSNWTQPWLCLLYLLSVRRGWRAPLPSYFFAVHMQSTLKKSGLLTRSSLHWQPQVAPAVETMNWHNYQDECSVPSVPSALPKLSALLAQRTLHQPGEIFYPRYPSLGANWETPKNPMNKNESAEMSGPWPLDQLGKSPTPSRRVQRFTKYPKFHGAVSSSPRFGQILVTFFWASVSIPAKCKTQNIFGTSQPCPAWSISDKWIKPVASCNGPGNHHGTIL